MKLMRKAEEQCRENELGLLSERVSENGLRGCPWLSVMSRWLRAFFVEKEFHYKKTSFTTSQ